MLNDEERSYPVRIDPDTYVPSDEFIFATISQGQPDTIYDWDSPAMSDIWTAAGGTAGYV